MAAAMREAEASAYLAAEALKHEGQAEEAVGKLTGDQAVREEGASKQRAAEEFQEDLLQGKRLEAAMAEPAVGAPPEGRAGTQPEQTTTTVIGEGAVGVREDVPTGGASTNKAAADKDGSGRSRL